MICNKKFIMSEINKHKPKPVIDTDLAYIVFNVC